MKVLNAGTGAVLFLILTLVACAGGEAGREKKDPALAHDARECQSLANLNGIERNGPQAYRAQALYNKCMRDRGWPGE